jgi:NADH-quinone oxidoreductase subunit C
MPDEEKPSGEPASSDQKPVEESKPAVESKPSDRAETPPAEQAAAEPPKAPAAAGGEKPPTAAEKPVAPSETPAAAAEQPAAENPASDKAAAAAEKPAAKPAAEKPAAKKAPPGMATSPWEGPLADRLGERFGAEITEFSNYLRDSFLVANLPAVFAILQYLKAEEGFDYLVDVTAVHYPEKEKPFEVVWILYSHPHNVRIRVKVILAEDETPRSVDSLYATANWLEREVYDMFGIAFAEHPNMTRILLPDEWQGYPLRKDYSIIQQDQDWVRENLNIESGQ